MNHSISFHGHGETGDRKGSENRLDEKLDEKLGEKRATILRLMVTRPSISGADLAQKLGISVTAVENHLKILRRSGYIRHIGPAKGGHWEVLNPSNTQPPKRRLTAMPVLHLTGCHYEPLGDYLKAPGIVRLVAEQLDPTARCWWKDGIFHLWLNPDDPYVLKFEGLAEKDAYLERDLETLLLNHLQAFLLELGTVCCFEARQRRVAVGNEHDYIDLVFHGQRDQSSSTPNVGQAASMFPSACLHPIKANNFESKSASPRFTARRNDPEIPYSWAVYGLERDGD